MLSFQNEQMVVGLCWAIPIAVVACFDVLVMKEPDLESFLQTERSYFASIVPDAALRPTAEAATRIEPCA